MYEYRCCKICLYTLCIQVHRFSSSIWWAFLLYQLAGHQPNRYLPVAFGTSTVNCQPWHGCFWWVKNDSPFLWRVSMLLGYLAPACWFLAAAACFSCLKFQRPPRHLIQHDEGKVKVDYFQTVRHESDLSTNDSFGCKTAGLDQGEFQVSSDRNSSMSCFNGINVYSVNVSFNSCSFSWSFATCPVFFLSHGWGRYCRHVAWI